MHIFVNFSPVSKNQSKKTSTCTACIRSYSLRFYQWLSLHENEFGSYRLESDILFIAAGGWHFAKVIRRSLDPTTTNTSLHIVEELLHPGIVQPQKEGAKHSLAYFLVHL